MPQGGTPSNGNFPSVSAMPVRFALLNFAGAGSLTTRELHNDGLVGFRGWFRQILGPGNVSVLVEFADGNVNPNIINWVPIAPAFAIGLAVPATASYSLGSRRWRATLTSTGVAQVEYRLTGALV